MDFNSVALAFFIVGTLILMKLKVKRYFIVFLIKTQKGIYVINWIAKLCPRVWMLLADIAVVVSFGGFGGAYLSRQGKRKSLYTAQLVFAFVLTGLVLLLNGVLIASAVAITLLVALISFYKAKSIFVDFFSTTALIYVIGALTFGFTGAQSASAGLFLLAGSVFGLPAIVISGLWMNASSILADESDLPGVSPLLPSAKDGNVGVAFPGYDLFIPWWYALIALIVTVVSHETAHGILAKAQNMRLKSTGILTVGILPIGAFVEPDEEELRQRKSIERMRVFAAGSFANICATIVAGAFYLVLLLFIATSLKTEGLEIVGTIEGYPAEGVIEVGTILYEVNDNKPDIKNLLGDAKPGDTITLKTDRGVIEIVAAEKKDLAGQAYVGVLTVPKLGMKGDIAGAAPWVPESRSEIEMFVKTILFLLNCMKWIMFFNFNIALVNLIPLAPFDGWHMIKELLTTFNISDSRTEQIALSILAFMIVLFLINLSPLGGKLVAAVF